MKNILVWFSIQSCLLSSFYFGLVKENNGIENIFISLVWFFIVVYLLAIVFMSIEQTQEQFKEKKSSVRRVINLIIIASLSVGLIYYGYIFTGLSFITLGSICAAIRYQLTPNNPT